MDEQPAVRTTDSTAGCLFLQRIIGMPAQSPDSFCIFHITNVLTSISQLVIGTSWQYICAGALTTLSWTDKAPHIQSLYTHLICASQETSLASQPAIGDSIPAAYQLFFLYATRGACIIISPIFVIYWRNSGCELPVVANWTSRLTAT